jgi:hypothetical protein
MPMPTISDLGAEEGTSARAFILGTFVAATNLQNDSSHGIGIALE